MKYELSYVKRMKKVRIALAIVVPLIAFVYVLVIFNTISNGLSFQNAVATGLSFPLYLIMIFGLIYLDRMELQEDRVLMPVKKGFPPKKNYIWFNEINRVAGFRDRIVFLLENGKKYNLPMYIPDRSTYEKYFKEKGVSYKYKHTHFSGRINISRIEKKSKV